jgi:hypothetical protein
MICQKCNNVGILNSVLEKQFYYCRTCKDEIKLEPKSDPFKIQKNIPKLVCRTDGGGVIFYYQVIPLSNSSQYVIRCIQFEDSGLMYFGIPVMYIYNEKIWSLDDLLSDSYLEVLL